MDHDRVASGIHIEGGEFVGAHDHEVGFEAQACVRPTRSHQIRTECEIGHEHPVHDIPMDTIGVCFLNDLAFPTQTGRVSPPTSKERSLQPLCHPRAVHRQNPRAAQNRIGGEWIMQVYRQVYRSDCQNAQISNARESITPERQGINNAKERKTSRARVSARTRLVLLLPLRSYRRASWLRRQRPADR